MNPRLSGALYVTLSAAAFGSMAIFARQAYAGGADVIAVLLLRFVIAAVLLSGFMLGTGRRWPRGRSLALLLMMGGLFYVAQSMSFFSALNHASAGLVALLLYLYPFIVTLLAALILRQPLGRGRVLAVLAALFGTALTLGGGFVGEPLGVVLGLAAALIGNIQPVFQTNRDRTIIRCLTGMITVGACGIDDEVPLRKALLQHRTHRPLSKRRPADITKTDKKN